jgi:hypothetical protein
MTETREPTRRNGARIAWRIAGAALTAFMLVYGTANAVGALARDAWRLHRTIPAGVRAVDVETQVGSITVLGAPDGAGPGVDVEMEVSRGLHAPSHSETLVGDRLVLRSGCAWFVSSWCSIDYVITVPEGVSVVARSDSGDVSVSNVHGDIQLSSSSGWIEVRDVVAGRAVLDADSGDVTVDGLAADSIEASSDSGSVTLLLDSSPTSIRATADSGDVQIALPDTPDAYRVDVSSDSGDTSADIRTDPASGRSIQASSDSGDVTVRYRGA